MNIPLIMLIALVTPQTTPTDIPKKDLPKEAICLMCIGEGPEKPAGGVMYMGKAYYFCNNAEIKAFKADPDAHVPPVLPRPAPKFELTAEDGKVWNAEAMKGKLILIDFWASWCKPCIEMMPAIDAVRAEYAPQGFEVLSVSIDQKRPDLDKFLKKHDFPNPVLHDTKQIWSNWGVKAIPATFLLKDGQIVAQWRGKITKQVLADSIKKHLAK